ncbi:ABC transporter ATP-binding protein [Halovulum sp. GXIMD14794]
MTAPLLEVSDLTITLGTGARAIDIVDGVSFSIAPGDRLGVVGESGSGKSMIALSLLGLLPRAMTMTRGKIRFDGLALAELRPERLREIRGRDISMIFQEPATALNPVFTTGEQVSEVLRRHERLSRVEARNRTIELFRQVGIPAPERRIADYPHQMSGGMRQRVMIAMALACRPRLLIADEPTTALDATIQRQIIDLLTRLQDETGVAIMLISHDLPLVASFARRIMVMYAGRQAETAPADTLFDAPRHPYTQGLIACALGLEDGVARLPAIEGQVPTPAAFPAGCRFATRCPYVQDRCHTTVPPVEPVGPAHDAACLRLDDLDARSPAPHTELTA